MIYRFLFVLLILSAAGCVQPVFDTPTAAPWTSTPTSPMPSATVAPSDTPTSTSTETATDVPTVTESPTPSSTSSMTATPSATITLSPTPSATATATASRTPRPLFTPGPTPTADVIVFSYPVTITVVPLLPENAPPIIRCLLLNYDFTFEPGKNTIVRRNKAAYFECVAKEQ